MSKTTPTASSSSNIGAIIEESLTKYEEQTKKDLRTHPLMAKLKPEANKSTAEILATFRTQVEQFKKFASGDDKLMKSLNPIVNVLCAFSSVIGAGVGLAFSPANVIFAGAGVLLSVAKDVIASHDALIEIFERIGRVFNRLEEYTDMQEMEAIKDIIIEIMVEVLKIFAIMTKAVEQGRTKRLLKVFFKRLIGRTDIKDALSRLDKLTQEEVKMVLAQVWKATDRIEGRLGTVSEGLNVVGDNVNRLIKDGKDREAHKNEEKRRQEIEETRKHVRDDKKWLSPPDPSTNQNKNIASHARRKGSATWFFKENIFIEWKSKSTTSLLWIHGKPGSGKSVLCSAIIKDIMVLQQKRLATMAYFYFDFKDTTKQSRHNALLSLLTQLSACSNGYCDILCGVYKEHNNGTYQPDTEKMVECLKEMLTLPDQPPVYIFLDALDECPKTSGVPPARKQVLDLLKDLVDLRLSSLHICVTSRRESDIEAALQRISSHSSISIQNQSGQKKDIEDYIKFVVYAESDTAMGEWSDEDRRLVIKTLTERADGISVATLFSAKHSADP
ncbi:hypothetical protein EI94DRAFT_645563 [Lactarius quietus]|nr:hypothetical protein EI94DRAFT_645563 [Lactarius quietus]